MILRALFHVYFNVIIQWVAITKLYGNQKVNYNFEIFNRRLLLTTLTELNAIAAPAIIGLSKNPFMGNSMPAAMGIPMIL